MDSKILGSAGCVCDNAAAVTAAMLRDIQTLFRLPEAQYFHGKEFLRSSRFREVTQWSLVVSYQHFGTTYLSHLQESSSLDSLTLDGMDKLFRKISN
jgi:hypothetical protein